MFWFKAVLQNLKSKRQRFKFLVLNLHFKVKDYSLTTQQENIVKLMKFARIESSYVKDKYYLQNLYDATFLMDNQKTETFLVWIDESEVYRHVV